MGGKPSPDKSGEMMAMIAAQAAQQEYQLGEQQLQWAKDVWNKEQPLVTEAEQTQIDLAKQQQQSMQQADAESRAQWDLYQQYYAPLEAQVATQVQDWASPQAMAVTTGQAQANVAEQTAQGVNTAKEALFNYGVNPDSPELAGLYIGANTMGAAGEAAAGTTAAQNLRMQQMQLEQAAAGQGQNIAGQSGQFTQVATGAGQAGVGAASGAAGTSQQNLATGSSAFTAPVNWYNSGATNMGVYTNAVNQYNQQQYNMAALSAQELGGAMQGIGNIAGEFLMPGSGFNPMHFATKGGPIGFQEGGGVANGNGNGKTGLPPPSNGTPGGFVPASASPSGGQETDDVDAKLTVGEFVIPKDVVAVRGTDYYYKDIDKARQMSQSNSQRDDIGGEQVTGIPSGPPAFVSRPPAQMPQIRPQPIPMGIPSSPSPMMQPNYG
jgi:hypothetical protein